jgi:hypothetical protein
LIFDFLIAHCWLLIFDRQGASAGGWVVVGAFAPGQWLLSFGRMKLLTVIFCIGAGCVVGTLVLGYGLGTAIGLYSQWQHPNDPSAGSVAIFGACTAPVGFVLGGLVGGFVGVARVTAD